MVVHKPWIGPCYKQDQSEERLAILGYSHYLGGGKDHEDMTISMFDPKYLEYCKGADAPFFSKIAEFFGVETPVFWNDVIFLNLIPEAIGDRDAMYDWASHDLAVAGSDRLSKILKEEHVDKLFVFSAKAWDSLPETVLRRDLLLDPSSPYGFNALKEAPDAVAFHLRHPQFAPPAKLKELEQAVHIAVSRKVEEFRQAIAKAGHGA